MAYVLNALVTTPDVLRAHGLVVVPLRDGLALSPLGESFWTALAVPSQPLLRAWEAREAREAPDDEFDDPEERAAQLAETSASWDRVAALCAGYSASGPIAYLEAEFFGGGGGQAAAAWRDGTLIWGPRVDERAISDALAAIGVVRGLSSDEFDALGLGRHRFTDDWLALAQV